MAFARYAVRRVEDGETDVWVSIGTGYTPDIEFAHLYSTIELATSKTKVERKAIKAYTEHTGKVVDYVVDEFAVQLKGSKNQD